MIAPGESDSAPGEPFSARGENPARPPRRDLPRRLPTPLRFALRLFWTFAGALSFAVAIDGFLRPNGLLSGGVTGTALLAAEHVRIPVGLLVLLLNLPIFLLGTRVVGRRFASYSALAVVTSWLLIDHAPIRPLTNDPLLAGIFGGVFSGLGTALALRAGGSLGGFDILGVVVNRRFAFGVGEVLMVLNGALIAAKGILGSPELALYTLLGIYVTGRTLDSLLAVRPRKAFLIVSRSAARIRQRILSEMRRGLTMLPAARAPGGEYAPRGRGEAS